MCDAIPAELVISIELYESEVQINKKDLVNCTKLTCATITAPITGNKAKHEFLYCQTNNGYHITVDYYGTYVLVPVGKNKEDVFDKELRKTECKPVKGTLAFLFGSWKLETSIEFDNFL